MNYKSKLTRQNTAQKEKSRALEKRAKPKLGSAKNPHDGCRATSIFCQSYFSLVCVCDENCLEFSRIKYEIEHAHCTSFKARQQNEEKSHDNNSDDNKKNSQLKSSTAKEKSHRLLGTPC